MWYIINMEDLDMEILTIKEASKEWGICERRISALCKQGRISGAVKVAGVWILPKNSQKPKDARIKSGKYVGWRNNAKITSYNYENNLKNLVGTFAVEGITISEECVRRLKKISNGEVSCFEMVENLRQKYTKRI